MTVWLTKNLGFQSMHEDFPEDASVVSALDLKDGWNDPELIYKKAKKILSKLARGKKVVIFCHAGLSRSPGLGILAIAYQRKTSYQDTLFSIKELAPQIQVNTDFAYACKEALELLNTKLIKRCKCGAPIESWEESCEYCFYNQ